MQILRRSPLDGLGSGPQLADQIEAAVRATAGNPAAIPQAEQLMSAAWVLYVQTIKKPTPGMIYAYDVLKPQGTRTDQILLGGRRGAVAGSAHQLDRRREPDLLAAFAMPNGRGCRRPAP